MSAKQTLFINAVAHRDYTANVSVQVMLFADRLEICNPGELPPQLTVDSFEAFMADRQKRLLGLIEKATGKAAFVGDGGEEGEDVESDEDTAEAEMTIAT